MSHDHSLLGILSMGLFSILEGRAFSIRWENPLPFELAFDSPNVDWSYPYTPTLEALHPLYGEPKLVQEAVEISMYNHFAPELDVEIPSMQWLNATKRWVKVSY